MHIYGMLCFVLIFFISTQTESRQNEKNESKPKQEYYYGNEQSGYGYGTGGCKRKRIFAVSHTPTYKVHDACIFIINHNNKIIMILCTRHKQIHTNNKKQKKSEHTVSHSLLVLNRFLQLQRILFLLLLLFVSELFF